MSWYLKEDVYFEPLFNHWYAWAHLIPPVTAARHAVNTHRRIMQSFVNNYHLHVLANQEKGLTGGEYLKGGEEAVPRIRALLEDFDENCAELIALSDAVKELDELLRKHTSGETLVPLYAKIPKPLKGAVELFFDMEHRPSYRFLEPLLYKSPYYKPALQSLSFGLLSRMEERPFVFSTPRLPDDDHIQMKLDFTDPLVDRLFNARETPLGSAEKRALLESVETAGGLSVDDLFTRDSPPLVHEPVEAGVKLTYTGHAGFLIETQDVSILVDPVIASRDKGQTQDMVSFSELPPKLDYICLTHSHQDHANLETLLQLRYKTRHVLVPKNNGGTLADPSIRHLLGQLEFDAIEIDELDEVAMPGGRIVAIPFLGEHGDLNIRSKTAWFFEVLGKRFFFGADSSNPDRELYDQLGKTYGDLDVLAIGMECVGAPYTWIYGALHSKPVSKAIKNSRRLNGSDCRQALGMLDAFRAKQVLIYALGLEPCYKYFMGLEYDDDSTQIVESNEMLDACGRIGVEAESLCGRKSIWFDA